MPVSTCYHKQSEPANPALQAERGGFLCCSHHPLTLGLPMSPGQCGTKCQSQSSPLVQLKPRSAERWRALQEPELGPCDQRAAGTLPATSGSCGLPSLPLPQKQWPPHAHLRSYPKRVHVCGVRAVDLPLSAVTREIQKEVTLELAEEVHLKGHSAHCPGALVMQLGGEKERCKAGGSRPAM